MNVQRLLQITMAAMAAMGTVLLSMGQREVVLPLVMILAAGASVWLTDIKGFLRLNRTLANIAMLVAALVSVRELMVIRSEIQAIGFARLLIYLQIIVLFQKKDERSYWVLIMLSLLQVVVAALFSQGVVFGLMLIIYMLVSSLGLTLLLFQRQWEQYSRPPTPGPASAARRWPWAGQKSELIGGRAGGMGLGRELYARLAGIGMRAMGATVLLFIFLPRFGQVGWIGSIQQSLQTVGFNDKVSLGALGQIIENPDEVMRIRFFDQNNDTPYAVHGAIYLRGAVLMEYRRGQWSAGEPARSVGNPTLARQRGKPLPLNLVRQECIIEGLDRPELFYVAPLVPVRSDLYITIDESQLRLLRSDHLRNTRYEYKLGTTALVNGVQQPLVPGNEKEFLFGPVQTISPPDAPNQLPNLVRLAQTWIDESKLPRQDRVGRARYLERKLATSGTFTYSLETQDRDPAIDPIEDFLTKHRAGHCEYFATALTLMLRSQGIPARMVVGYRTDEWNQIAQCYQVRQLHAHTWVECWLRPSQIPRQLLHGEDYWPWSREGGWLQLDPTPESEARAQTGWLSPISKTWQWFDYAWSYYVVELNYERQRNAIFRPIVLAIKFVYNFVTDAEAWRGLFERIGGALHLRGISGVVAWMLLVAACLAGAALMAFLCWSVWRLADRLWRIVSGRPAKRRKRPAIEVEFYRRLEGLLAASGLVRAPGQTQREFAHLAGNALARTCGQSELALAPARVAEAFYRVRFGRLPLDSTVSEEVEQSLRQIAAAQGGKSQP
jgi:transglutaminase-like putative cysteine protease